MDLPEIDFLLPHRPPMILLDNVIERGVNSVTCSVTLHQHSPFIQNGQVRAVMSLEYMAQCVAAFVGWNARDRGEEPKIGYLLGCRDLVLNRDQLFVGEEFMVTTEQVWGNPQLASFHCKITHDGERVASGVLNVYQPVDSDTVPE